MHPKDLLAAIRAKEKVRDEQIISSSSSVDTSTKDIKEKERIAIVSALSLKKNLEFESRINPSESGSSIASISDLQPLGNQLSSALTISPRSDNQLERESSIMPITDLQLLKNSMSNASILEDQLHSQSLDDKSLNNQSISNVSEILISEILDQIPPEETCKDQLKKELSKSFAPVLSLVQNGDLEKNSLMYLFDKKTGKKGAWYGVTTQQNDIILQSVLTYPRPAISVVPRSTPSSFGIVRQGGLTNNMSRTQNTQKHVLGGSFFTRPPRVKPLTRRAPKYDPNQVITRPCPIIKLVATVDCKKGVATKIENRPTLFEAGVVNPFVLTGYPNRIYNSPISDKNLRKIQTKAYQASESFPTMKKNLDNFNKKNKKEGNNRVELSEDQFQTISKLREFIEQLLGDIDNNRIDVKKIV